MVADLLERIFAPMKSLPSPCRALDVVLKTTECIGGVYSLEKPGTIASNSEIRRWMATKSVLIDGVGHGIDDMVEMPVRLVEFKTRKRCITIPVG